MEGKRAGSRYCKDACKQKAHRITVTQTGSTNVTPVTDNPPVDVTVKPQSMNRKCGPIPGDPDYDGVALQEKYGTTGRILARSSSDRTMSQ